VLKTITA